MLHRLERFERLAAHALAWGLRRDELGKLGFEINHLAVKAVVLLVRNTGLSQDVIRVVVLPDFLDELGVTGFGFI
jgi:hypothetical protein